jgi:hypothetical protein
MLDFIGMVITATLMVLVVTSLITFMDVSRVAKITLAAVIGVWIGLAAAVAEPGGSRSRDRCQWSGSSWWCRFSWRRSRPHGRRCARRC